ncbi:winged helix-turn-helix transcriptional regulator [Jatrophihabitans lederbergiae]|uniref:Helix-turn-helix domain-containing protein n=1 Tax=Jatrophihabitans lederbergiae TaxID=3075547 RepID=A0ABU2JHI9_9ACTN|nr:helix-turn-helix domain-containing protein [Jatrophihabitans sp. DSM 44399]MDT0264419.1 helix-turn-helix domain-containing protein [Jatrophihabitans sp. DSM 44399]
MAPERPAGFLHDWYDARALLAAEWAPAIVGALLDGPLPYKDILAAAGAARPGMRWGGRHRQLHDSILSRSLQAMTGDGLLERHETPGTFPPTVYYCLTDACRELAEAATPLAEWSARHRDVIERAQSRRTRTGRLRRAVDAAS